MKKTFFIVEDHALMRHGISSWISEHSDWECVGMAENLDGAFGKIGELQGDDVPAVLITDISLSSSLYDYSGLEIIKEMGEKFPGTKCICFSMYTNPGLIKIALNNGAKGYISKTATEEELLKCMEKVFAGEEYIENNLYSSITTYINATASLTKREKAVIELIIKHKTNEQIAEILGIQKRAVESYTSRIYDKLGCNSRNSLITLFE